MKTIFFLSAICFFVVLSCKKSANNDLPDNSVNQKLKAILSPRDTVTPLCVGCPSVISQKTENFNYDNSNRLISRVLTTSILSATPVTVDTNVIYRYTYAGPVITNYTHHQNNVTVNHVLSYDSQNRLLLDSVTNPQQVNNKRSHFRYLPDTIIQTHYFSDAVASFVSIDTVILAGDNIIKEKIKTVANGSSSSYRETTYSPSSYRNPLSYLTNFSLLASDHKNASDYYLFLIYTPQNITYNLTSYRTLKYWSNPSSVTQYSSNYIIALDAAGRVHTVNDPGNNNKQTVYEYY